MKIDHIGYAVKNIEKARECFQSLGFLFEEVVKDVDRNIYIQFGWKDGYKLELVAPIGKGSPVDGYLSSIGAVPYHLCFSSDSLEADIKKLEEEHYKVIVPAARATAFGNKKVVFMMNRNIGLVEIVETEEFERENKKEN